MSRRKIFGGLFFYIAVLSLTVPMAEACEPLVIAHRGASGDLPEHTMAAYSLAIEQGADYIEPDLVPTRDGHLIARHENVLAHLHGEATTNISALARFADRRTSKSIFGHLLEGWFSEDLTLAEIKALRARERLPELRPQSAAHDDRYAIPRFDEVVALARQAGVGIYPELKAPDYFASLGIDVVALFVGELERLDVDLSGPIYIQSFHAPTLERLRKQLGPKAKLIQLSGGTPELSEVAGYADGVGLPIARALEPGFIMSAHVYDLQVHPYTLRAESEFLPAGLTFEALFERLIAAGIDGVFTDHPGRARTALEACVSR